MARLDGLLVVGDSAARGRLTEALEQRGHEVVTIDRIEDALDLVARHTFLLVVVDRKVGDDSLDLCRAVRRSASSATTSVLVLTTNTDPADLSRVVDAGADDILIGDDDPVRLDVRLALAERRLAAGVQLADLLTAEQERDRLRVVVNDTRSLQHRLSNQIAAALGYTELLAADTRLGEDLRSMAERAYHGALMANETLQQLRHTTLLSPPSPDQHSTEQ